MPSPVVEVDEHHARVVSGTSLNSGPTSRLIWVVSSGAAGGRMLSTVPSGWALARRGQLIGQRQPFGPDLRDRQLVSVDEGVDLRDQRVEQTGDGRDQDERTDEYAGVEVQPHQKGRTELDLTGRRGRVP